MNWPWVDSGNNIFERIIILNTFEVFRSNRIPSSLCLWMWCRSPSSDGYKLDKPMINKSMLCTANAKHLATLFPPSGRPNAFVTFWRTLHSCDLQSNNNNNSLLLMGVCVCVLGDWSYSTNASSERLSGFNSKAGQLSSTGQNKRVLCFDIVPIEKTTRSPFIHLRYNLKIDHALLCTEKRRIKNQETE